MKSAINDLDKQFFILTLGLKVIITKEISILEVIVGQKELQIENDKIKIVKKWKIPTKIKKVESFIEFTNFYRYFIKNFSHTAKLSNELKCYDQCLQETA